MATLCDLKIESIYWRNNLWPGIWKIHWKSGPKITKNSDSRECFSTVKSRYRVKNHAKSPKNKNITFKIRWWIQIMLGSNPKVSRDKASKFSNKSLFSYFVTLADFKFKHYLRNVWYPGNTSKPSFVSKLRRFTQCYIFPIMTEIHAVTPCDACL